MSKRGYLQGLLAANVAVAEVIGPIKIADMTDQTWQLAHAIQARLIAMAADEANRIENSDGRRAAGSNGGVVRAERLSPERRKEIAQQAANTRWGNGQ